MQSLFYKTAKIIQLSSGKNTLRNVKTAEKFQYESCWCLAASKCHTDRKRRAQKYQEHQNRQYTVVNIHVHLETQLIMRWRDMGAEIAEK